MENEVTKTIDRVRAIQDKFAEVDAKYAALMKAMDELKALTGNEVRDRTCTPPATR